MMNSKRKENGDSPLNKRLKCEDSEPTSTNTREEAAVNSSNVNSLESLFEVIDSSDSSFDCDKTDGANGGLTPPPPKTDDEEEVCDEERPINVAKNDETSPVNQVQLSTNIKLTRSKIKQQKAMSKIREYLVKIYNRRKEKVEIQHSTDNHVLNVDDNHNIEEEKPDLEETTVIDKETNDLPGDNLVTKSSTDDCNNDNSSAQRSAASDNDTDGESCSTSRRKIYKRRLISSNLKTVLIKKVITRKSKSPPVVKSERDSLKAEKLYIKENLQTISGQIKLINESKANKKLAHLLMGSLSTHVDKIVDTVRIRKKSKTKSTRSAQIVDLKNGKLDLNTPESILTSLNLADVINRKIFDQLPSYYQYRITKLLPHCDQVIMGNNVICPTLTAFSNEFFSKSIVSYAGRLSDGKLTSESISKLKKEIEREKNRLDPLKLKYFEPYFKIPEEEKPADLSDDERVQVDLTFLDTMATCFDKFVQIKSKTNFDNNDSVDGEKCSKPLQVRFDESVILCAEDFKKLFLSLKNQLNTSSDEPEVKNKVDNNNSELCLDNSKPLEQLDYEEQLAFNQIVIDDYLKPKEARMKFSEESFDEILCNNLICYNVITGGILINWSSYYHLLDMCVKLIKLLGHALKSYMPHFDVMSKCGDIILSPLRDFSDRCLEFVNSLNRISDIELVPVNIDCFEQATIPKIFLKKVYSQSVPSETSLPALVYFNDVRIKTFNTFMASSQRMQVKLRQLIHFMPYKPIGSITAHIETIASFSSFVSFCQSTIPMLCHVPEDQIFPDEEEFEGEEEEEEEEDEEED